MLKRMLGSVFGTRHERERKRVQPIVDEINVIGQRLASLSDDELKAQTAKFRDAIRERTAALSAEIATLKDAKKTAADPQERERIDLELTGADGSGGLEGKFRDGIRDVLDDLVPEAFATVREAARRLVGTTVNVTGRDELWNMVHYDVQLIGGIELHLGRIRSEEHTSELQS